MRVGQIARLGLPELAESWLHWALERSGFLR